MSNRQFVLRLILVIVAIMVLYPVVITAIFRWSEYLMEVTS